MQSAKMWEIIWLIGLTGPAHEVEAPRHILPVEHQIGRGCNDKQTMIIFNLKFICSNKTNCPYIDEDQSAQERDPLSKQKISDSIPFPEQCARYNIQRLRSMDFFFALKSTILNAKDTKEFAYRLKHASNKLTQDHLGELLLLLAKNNTPNFRHYLIQMVKQLEFYDRSGVDINYDKGASGDRWKQTCLMVGCQKNCFQNVQAILENEDVNYTLRDSKDQNAILYALRNSNEEESYKIIRKLISMDSGLTESISAQGNSLLIQAISISSIRIIQLLLQNNANPNLQLSTSKNTALHYALKQFKNDPSTMNNIILLLLKFGANPMIKNSSNQTPYNIAASMNFDLHRLVRLFNDPETKLNLDNKASESEISVTKDEYFSASDESRDECSQAYLQKQIQEVYYEYQSEITSAWSDIQVIYLELQRIGLSKNMEICLIGSFPTRLWTNFSDIDISLVNLNQNSINTCSLLADIYKNFTKNYKKLEIQEIFLNNQGLFPNIKLELTPEMNSRKIDITIYQKKTNVQKYVRYIEQCISVYPHIITMFYLYHKLLKSFNLHLFTRGGLKTYAMFLMILHFVHHCSAETMMELFTKFISFYANYFQYHEYVDENGQYKKQLNLIDPLNASNNAGGKKTNAEKLHRMFKIVDSGLRLGHLSGIQQGGLSYLFELNNCLPLQE